MAGPWGRVALHLRPCPTCLTQHQAVAVRRGTGITDDPELFSTPLPANQRFHLAWVVAVVRGSLRVGSVYLKGPTGVVQDNIEVLQEIAIVIRARVGLWAIGGDWNVTLGRLFPAGL